MDTLDVVVMNAIVYVRTAAAIVVLPLPSSSSRNDDTFPIINLLLVTGRCAA